VTRVEGDRNACRVLVGKPEGKRNQVNVSAVDSRMMKAVVIAR
jgi:hypothetical protein